jgi:hypothetical protein
MAGDGPVVLTSPYELAIQDNFGQIISITITFNNNTRAITGCTVYRDATCQWTKIFVGLGADGTPNTAAKTFNVPAGTTTITPQQLSARGVNTIEDVVSYQITAGT